MQKNFITGQEYKGQNQIILNGLYTQNEWATFLQWKTAGFNVKKGQKGTRIIKIVAVDSGQTDLGKKTNVPRFYTVFNREQVEPVMQMVNTPLKTNSYGKLAIAR
jgi:antirestriction protein ArdC